MANARHKAHRSADWRSIAGMPQAMSNLLLAGCWMYAGAPEACLAYMRDVFSNHAAISRRVESIGRVVSFDDDVSAALKWLIDRLRNKVTPRPITLRLIFYSCGVAMWVKCLIFQESRARFHPNVVPR